MIRKPASVIIAGPSGSGKSELVELVELVEQLLTVFGFGAI